MFLGGAWCNLRPGTFYSTALSLLVLTLMLSIYAVNEPRKSGRFFTHSIPEHDVQTKLPTVMSVYVTPGWLHSKQCLFTPDWASSRTLRAQISWLSRCLRFDILFPRCLTDRLDVKPVTLRCPPPESPPFYYIERLSRPHYGNPFMRLHPNARINRRGGRQVRQKEPHVHRKYCRLFFKIKRTQTTGDGFS